MRKLPMAFRVQNDGHAGASCYSHELMCDSDFATLVAPPYPKHLAAVACLVYRCLAESLMVTGLVGSRFACHDM